MSNTIDERVVVLKFDNKDFEANAQKSLETLDQLDKSMRFDNTSKSLSGFMVSSKSLGLTSIGESVDGLSKRFSNLGIVGMTALSEITKKAVDTGLALAKNLINPIMEGGKSRALNLAQADFMLHGVIEDEKEIEAVMDAASKSVDGTAYSLDVAAKAAAQFAAAGVSSGDDLKNVMDAVAGTAATFNADYQGVAEIFNKVASSGRVMGTEFKQLQMRGVPVTETLVEYINGVNSGTKEASDSVKAYVAAITDGMQIAGEDIVEFRKKGVLSFELFSAAMSDAFGEHAKDANKTFTGALSNVKSALARIGALFYTPLLDNEGPVVQFLNAIRVAINRVKDALAPLADVFTGVIGNMLTKAADFINVLTKANEQTDAFSTAITGVTTKVADGLKKAFGVEPIEEAEEAVEKVNKALKTVTPEEAQAAWDIWQKGSYGNGQDRIKNLEAIGLSYQNVQDYVNALYEANFDLAKMEIQVGEAGETSGKQLAEAAKKAKEETDKSVKAMSPISKLFVSIANFGKGFKNIGSNLVGVFTSIGKAFKKVFSANKITNSLVDISSRFKDFTSKLTLNDEQLTGIRKAFEGVFKVIDLLGRGIGKISIIFGGVLFKGLTLAGKGFIKLFGYINSIFKSVGGVEGVIKRLKNTFKTFTTTVSKSSGFKKFRTELEKIAELLVGKVSKGFSFLKSSFESLTGTKFKFPSVEDFANGLSSLLGVIGEFLEKVRSGDNPISKFFEKIKDFFKPDGLDIDESGIDATQKKFDEIFERVKSIRDGYINQVSELFGGNESNGPGEKIKGFFNGIIQKIKEIDWASIKTVALDVAKALVSIYAIWQMGVAFQKVAAYIGSFAWVRRANAVKTFATAVAIICGAIAVLAVVGKKYDLEKAEGIVLSALGTMFFIMIALDKMTAGRAKLFSMGAAFAGMGLGLLMVAGACAIIARIPVEDLKKAGLAISALAVIMAIAARISGGKGGLGFASMGLGLMLIVPVMLALALVPWDFLLKGVGKLALIMGIIALASRIAGGAAGGALKMLTLALAVDLVIPAILVLAFLPLEKAVQGAGLLAILMFALAGAATLASGAAKGAGAMVAAALAAIAAAAAVSILGSMDIDTAKQGIIALITVLGAIALAANLANGAATGALAIVGVMAIMTIAFVILTSLDTGAMQSAALSLSATVMAIGVVIAVLGMLPITTGATAAANLLSFLGILGGAMLILGAVFDHFKILDKKLEKGIQVLEKVGEGLGRIIAAFGKGLSSGLPEIGQNLGDFYTNAQPFFDGMKGFDSSVFQGISDLASSMLKFTGGNILDNLQGLFTGKSSLTQVGEELANFIKAFLPAAMLLQAVPAGIEEKAGMAIGVAKAVSEKGQDIKGVKLGNTGEELAEFGKSFLTFSIYMNKAKTDAVTSATASIRTTVGVIKSVNQNGGDSSALVTFGLNIYDFAQDFAKFSDAAAEVNAGGVEGLIKSAKEMLAFAKSAEGVNTSGLSSISASMGSFVSGFSASMASAGSINMGNLSGLQSQMSQLQGIVTQAQGLDSGAITKFVNAFNQAGSKGVDSFIKAFTGAAGKARSAAASVVSAASSGITSVSASVSSTAYSVGAAIGQGVIRGLDSTLATVRAKAAEIGRLAAQATRQGAQVNSPSKISIFTGEGIGEGIVVGLNRMASTVVKSGADMGKDAADSVSTALNRMKDIIQGDYGDLTITPVLDLSEVESRAAQLSGIFGDQTVGLNGFANSAAASIAGMRNAESANDKLISTLKGMKSNSQNNTFNITVDGTENPEAFADRLIRRIKVKSRI